MSIIFQAWRPLQKIYVYHFPLSPSSHFYLCHVPYVLDDCIDSRIFRKGVLWTWFWYVRFYFYDIISPFRFSFFLHIVFFMLFDLLFSTLSSKWPSSSKPYSGEFGGVIKLLVFLSLSLIFKVFPPSLTWKSFYFTSWHLLLSLRSFFRRFWLSSLSLCCLYLAGPLFSRQRAMSYFAVRAMYEAVLF